jgi:hypothetical protein
MNQRLFSMALLISALPFLSSQHASGQFNKGDFIARERGAVVQMKLSKSGKAKVKKLRSFGFSTVPGHS